MNQQNVIAYIDGFNLYFGLKAKKWNRFYWLNLEGMVKDLLKPNQVLIKTKYFTSRIGNNPQKQKRQNTYLDAIQAYSPIDIYYGVYQLNKKTCLFCNKDNIIPNEKMTDVNIATEILSDAFQNLFDIALLVSADSDLVAPVKKVQSLFPSKESWFVFLLQESHLS